MSQKDTRNDVKVEFGHSSIRVRVRTIARAIARARAIDIVKVKDLLSSDKFSLSALPLGDKANEKYSFNNDDVEALMYYIIHCGRFAEVKEYNNPYAPDNIEVIETRLSQGYTLEGLARVIEVGATHYLSLGDNKLKRHINPKTLLGSKFDEFAKQAGIKLIKDNPPIKEMIEQTLASEEENQKVIPIHNEIDKGDTPAAQSCPFSDEVMAKNGWTYRDGAVYNSMGIKVELQSEEQEECTPAAPFLF